MNTIINTIINIVLFVIVIAIVGTTIYFYNKNKTPTPTPTPNDCPTDFSPQSLCEDKCMPTCPDGQSYCVGDCAADAKCKICCSNADCNNGTCDTTTNTCICNDGYSIQDNCKTKIKPDPPNQKCDKICGVGGTCSLLGECICKPGFDSTPGSDGKMCNKCLGEWGPEGDCTKQWKTLKKRTQNCWYYNSDKNCAADPITGPYATHTRTTKNGTQETGSSKFTKQCSDGYNHMCKCTAGINTLICEATGWFNTNDNTDDVCIEDQKRDKTYSCDWGHKD